MIRKPHWWLINLLVQPLLAERCAAFLRSAQAAGLLQANDYLPVVEWLLAAPSIDRPTLSRSQSLPSFGQPVGRLTITRSIGGELLRGIPLLAGSLAIAWLIWNLLRRLPLRALADAESVLVEGDQ